MELAADNPFTTILGDGETILWTGKPDINLLNRHQKSNWRFFAFGIMALLCYGALSSLLTGNPDRVLFFMLSLVFVPLAIGPFFVDWCIPRQQYAVTNQRVLYYNVFGEDDDVIIKHLAFHQINLVWLRPKRVGKCSVVFEAKPPFKKVAFDYVADVAEVQELVVSLLTGVKLEARK